MAYTTCSVDTAIIAGLGTTPDERGLTTEEFKGKFDESPTGIKGYLNNTLIPQMENGLAHSMARQALINGNFDIWQRANTVTNPSGTYTCADRWGRGAGADGGTFPTTIIHSREALTSGDIPNSYYYYRININGAGSSYGTNSYHYLLQQIENGVRYLCGLNKKVTVSFYARSSITNKKLGISITQNYGTGGSPTSAELINGRYWTLTSSWTKYSHTFTTNTIVGKTFGTNNDDRLALNIWQLWGASSTSYVGDTVAESFVGSGTIDIAQVQLCAGDTVLTFQPKSFDDELKACMRYYEKSYDYAVAPGTASTPGCTVFQTRTAIAGSASGTLSPGVLLFKVSKRTTPTITLYSIGTGAANAIRNTAGADRTGCTGTYNGTSGFSQITADNTSATNIALDATLAFQWASESEL
jgi:hypothetical protein